MTEGSSDKGVKTHQEKDNKEAQGRVMVLETARRMDDSLRSQVPKD